MIKAPRKIVVNGQERYIFTTDVEREQVDVQVPVYQCKDCREKCWPAVGDKDPVNFCECCSGVLVPRGTGRWTSRNVFSIDK